jgi:hypothetical protein
VAAPALFDRACEELEGASGLSRLEARGTLRLAVKAAGFEPLSVNRPQLLTVLLQSLPRELESRGVRDARGVCEGVAARLAAG